MLDSTPPTRLARPSAARILQLVRFTWASGAGLLTDLTVFGGLLLLGVPATPANLTSTALAITLTYLLVSRHAFGAAATTRTYVLFFAWYASTAAAVSVAIGVLGGGVTTAELAWKVAFVPVTFTANYCFGRWLFRDRPAAPASAARPLRDSPAARVGRAVVRHPWISSAVATTVFAVLVLPMNEAMSFAHQTEPFAVLREHGTRIAFLLALGCLVRWAIGFAAGVARRDPHHTRWLGATALMLVLLAPFFFTLYPGYWVQDEFDTLWGATNFTGVAWQGYLTHVYYAFCLFLLPSKVGIVVVQVAFIAIVVGYATTVLAARLRNRWFALAVPLVLLSPAVLLNDFYPLRLTPYGYLLLLVVVHLVHRAGTWRADRVVRAGEFFALCCAVAVLAFWRTEGIVALLLLGPAFVVTGMASRLRVSPGRVGATALAGLLTIAFTGWLTSATSDPKYQLSAMINPLSTMVQGPLQGPDVERDLAAIDRVVALDALRASPSYTESPAFFTGLRGDAVEHLPEFRAAYLDLVLHNPGPFLDNRWHAFLAANGQDWWVPQVNPGAVNGSNGPVQEKFASFQAGTLFGTVIDAEARSQVARHLLMLNARLEPTIGLNIFWNTIPAIGAVLLAFVVALVRRRWTAAVCGAVVLGGTGLVVLSEPAAYFMYYVPVLLCGSVATGALVAVALDRLLARGTRSAPVALPGARPSVLLAVPAYNCAPQVGRVLAAIDPALQERIDRVMVIDNVSTDGTAEAAADAIERLGLRGEVWRNRSNHGLGGSHKVAFDAGRRLGADYVAILHGDDQADAQDLHRLLDAALADPELGAVLGGRFQRGSRRIGYSKVRTAGNAAINVAYSIVAGRRSLDLGSGLNLFRVADLEDGRYRRFDDSLTFNIDLLLDYYAKRTPLKFVPISWREEDQVSNARNMKIGRAALSKLLRWRFAGVALQPEGREYASAPFERTRDETGVPVG